MSRLAREKIAGVAMGLLCAVALGRLALAQGAKVYSVSGVVVNALGGEPVSHAQVALLAESDSHPVAATRTDGSGRFALPNLPAAKYQLTASKRGFHTAFFEEHDLFNSAVVTGPGQDTEHLLFRLPPNASLRGVVTDDGGDPVDGARVMLFQLPAEHGREAGMAGAVGANIAQTESTTTDDTGAYEFSNLMAGRYALAIVAQPWYAVHGSARGGNSSLDVAYPVTYYDSTTDEASATPIALAAGAREEANLVLHAAPALHLTVGSARNPRDKTAVAAIPSLQQSVFGVQIPVETELAPALSHTGVSEFAGLAPGHYELIQGNPPRIVEIDATGSQQIDETEGTPTVSIVGTLLTPPDPAQPEAIVLGLSPAEGGRRVPPLSATVQKGQFRFDAVLPGKWELRMWCGGVESEVISILQGGRAHPGSSLTVGDRPLTLAVASNQGAARVRGFARKDGKGFAGAMVVLVPRDPLGFPALVRRDQSDSDGSFSLNGAAPGDYTVVAIEGGWGPNSALDWSDSKELARYLPGGVAVHVSGSAAGTVRLSGPVAVQSK